MIAFPPNYQIKSSSVCSSNVTQKHISLGCVGMCWVVGFASNMYIVSHVPHTLLGVSFSSFHASQQPVYQPGHYRHSVLLQIRGQKEIQKNFNLEF